MGKAQTVERLESVLDKKYGNIKDYRYNCFYRALDGGYGNNKKLWQQEIITYMEEDSGSILDFYKRIAQSTQNNGSLPLRPYLPLTSRDSYNEHANKLFPFDGNKPEIELENAIKFNLFGKEHPLFGKFISYEVAVAYSDNTGPIDIIAYNGKKNELRLIEIKRYGIRGHRQSGEHFLRAYSEIFTYRAFFDNYGKEFLSKEFEKTGYKIDFNEVKIINCIFGPKTMFGGIDKKFIDYLNEVEKQEDLKYKYGVELYEIYPVGLDGNTLVGSDKLVTEMQKIKLST